MDKGWICALDSEKNSRKKEYQITEEGRSAVLEELKRLQELLDNGTDITGGWRV